MPNAILRLALPSPLRRLFDYRAPAGVPARQLQPGLRLRVPFGRREVIGVLVEVAEHSEVPDDKLRPALELLDQKPRCPPSCSSSACGPPSTTSTASATPSAGRCPCCCARASPPKPARSVSGTPAKGLAPTIRAWPARRASARR